MNSQEDSMNKLFESLKERAKELNCLYTVEKILSESSAGIAGVCEEILKAIPPGCKYPDICAARIVIEDNIYESPNFLETEWSYNAKINMHDRVVGSISVFYTAKRPSEDFGPFLKEETKLIDTVADRLGHFVMYEGMKHVYEEWRMAKQGTSTDRRTGWQVVLDLLARTDRDLFARVTLKMLNHLCWSGIEEAEVLRKDASQTEEIEDEALEMDLNQPDTKQSLSFSFDLSERIFRIASAHLSDEDILSRLQRWIQEDKLGFLVQVVNRNLSLSEVTDAIRRYYHLAPDEVDAHSPSSRGVTVSLIRRFLSDHLEYINVAKHFINISDFYHLLKRVIFSADSHGKLGGKSAGLYIASQILKKSKERYDCLNNIKIPKTWHVTSDMLLHFMHYNNFDEIVEQKYKEIDQVRVEYPHIVQTFKNSHFPQDIMNGLSLALDDLKDCPLIVRSSSLLEDRVGASFSGKYKSLFVANQGTKRQRLAALMDAIAEVYASTFGPDPIEYRVQRGLIDFGEEMGIMIQEVVGSKVGYYFFPTFAGVGFSRNEFRWSSRIRREDGLVRLVPGLGTRAVDRTSDDYPVMIAPGQPGLRVNVSIDEIVRYSPRWIDVINLTNGRFETIAIDKLLKNYGSDIRNIEQVVSKYESGSIKQPVGLGFDFQRDDLVVTFDGLMSNTSFVNKMNTMLTLLEDKLGSPVDIEFASDGDEFYLLQCRPQSYFESSAAAQIPEDIPHEDLVFNATKYITDGKVPDSTYVVYVDPKAYSEIGDRATLLSVGAAVGKLNELLPRRRFILMGPGRWGSRGDIKLGVSVTYSDINNSSMLIEIAKKKGNYVPDLSFGTHFFQDLVESNISYLPLYPDDDGIAFNENFLENAKNFLPDLVPEYSNLKNVIHVIYVPEVSNGKILRILMNGDIEKAVGFLTNPE